MTATCSTVSSVRNGPGADHDAVRVVDAGTQVEATGEISGAYEKVKVGSEEGWVRSIYVDRGPEPEADDVRQAGILAAAVTDGHPLVTAGLSMVSDAEIVLRAQPSSTSQKVEVIPVNSKLTLTGNQSDGFLEVTIGTKTGWVASGYLREVAPPTGPTDVPVLMYHSIQNNGAQYQVTAGQLEEQLQSNLLVRVMI